MRVKLNCSQKEYLLKNLLNDSELLSIVANITQKNNLYYVDVADDEADSIRDLCCDKLDIYGFDENYELTSEGEILEELINLFYVDENTKS
ncbi:hypothetical protein [Desnuesiella massiliensis]|uniref:hypothetical protein n=1 Tax=Desnuesiella massiliensis TaxID=1650662 RepID=UPI0006E2E83E|nr:hypothetical protein [Desnuesiella massiliensis]